MKVLALLILSQLLLPGVQAQEGSNPFAARNQPLDLNLDPLREGNSCESVDLREEFRQRNLPDRRHQDTTGWCYAFVGADLVSYELRQNISPADIARQYLNHGTPEHLASLEAAMANPMVQFQPLGGGFTKKALDLTRTQGFCLESTFPSEDYSWSEEKALELIEKYPNKNDRPSVCLEADNVAPLYTGIPIDDLLALVRSDDFKRILNQLPRSHCNERIPFPNELEIKHVYKKGAFPYDHSAYNNFYQQVDGALTSRRPVSISISTDIFQRPVESMKSIRRAGHQVILAGRRLNQTTGRCEYLIRNSDSSCTSYHSEYECENNHVWIPREIVRMGTFGADFIDGPDRE